MNIRKAIIAGTGNVAWHLAKILDEKGINICQIYGRNLSAAKEIAAFSNAQAIDAIDAVGDADVYFITVADDAIEEIGRHIFKPLRLLVHTSGSVDSTILNFGNNDFGVFYPLQTITKYNESDFSKIPIFITSFSKQTENDLVELAKHLSTHVNVVTDEQRKIIHLCAVIVNNFTNYLFNEANDILLKNDLSLNLLFPLIEETIHKIKTQNFRNIQTGPAIRGDMKIIEKHLQMLNDNPEFAELYELISQNIRNKYLNV